MQDLDHDRQGRQPIFNIPGVVAILAGLMILIWVAGELALDEEGNYQLSLWFGFFPYRLLEPEAIPGGMLPLLWTLLTHAFLHANFEHVLLNTIWLAIFATPVARRYGAVSTLLIFALSAVVGAVAFAVTTLPEPQLLVGASGGVAGLTGAATRFIFQPVLVGRDPLTGEQQVLGRQLASFADLWRNPRARFFTLIWVVLNAAVPLVPAILGSPIAIAWQAHLGGFFTGLLLVQFFERRG